ncbi:pantoate--beta-alanine ligase [Sphingomonas antarctica]|uniref:pantoate--beta-alanine ligase n=1 Tax=Sphingomonas antarctica TaxID=2040274 RepID=UPI0039EADD7F
MQTVRTLPELRAARAAMTGRVAFVPTMGALHAGHMALVTAAREVADHVIASIFVNPLQFGPNEDLARYPRQEAADAALLVEHGCDLLWLPPVEVMYPAGFLTTVSVAKIDAAFDGAHRPGHFDGVATVVAKLFGQVRPDIALFGEKDWQQLAIIRRMALDLDMAVDVRGVPTVREADGLALSSRNAYLSAGERTAATELPRALNAAVAAIGRGEPVSLALAAARQAIAAAGFEIDYVELADAALQPTEELPARLLAAARIGTTRLIDNIPVTIRASR